MKKLIPHLLLISLFIFISGCSLLLNSRKYGSSSNESKVIALSGQTELTVSNPNGIISVASSDTAKDIYCKITKEVKSSESTSDVQSHLTDINVISSLSGSGVKIKVNNPKDDGRSYIINLEIVLPDNFNYNLTLGNGNINVNSPAKNLTLTLGNGTVKAAVDLKDNCNVSITVGNGSIFLRIPGTANAEVKAKVANGIVKTNGLSFNESHSSGKNLTGTLGTGAGSIDLTLGNGTIALTKK